MAIQHSDVLFDEIDILLIQETCHCENDTWPMSLSAQSGSLCQARKEGHKLTKKELHLSISFKFQQLDILTNGSLLFHGIVGKVAEGRKNCRWLVESFADSPASERSHFVKSINRPSHGYLDVSLINSSRATGPALQARTPGFMADFSSVHLNEWFHLGEEPLMDLFSLLKPF